MFRKWRRKKSLFVVYFLYSKNKTTLFVANLVQISTGTYLWDVLDAVVVVDVVDVVVVVVDGCGKHFLGFLSHLFIALSENSTRPKKCILDVAVTEVNILIIFTPLKGNKNLEQILNLRKKI